MAQAKVKADDVFNALGDPTRRAIVLKLVKGPSSVTQLAEPLGITLTAVKQHLDVLEASGLVSTRKVGRVRTCSFETKGLAVIETWVNVQRTMWSQALDRLGDFLDEED